MPYLRQCEECGKFEHVYLDHYFGHKGESNMANSTMTACKCLRCYFTTYVSENTLATSKQWQCRNCSLIITLDDKPDSAPQPPPTPGKTKVLDAVLKDLTDRAETGKSKYGTYLYTHNGRSALVDLYQELLDAAMYIKQLLLEQGESK